MRLRSTFFALAVCGLSGCTTTDVVIPYQGPGSISLVEDDAAKLEIGTFSDRRGQEPNWLGEVRGKYYYPKTILVSPEPVWRVVRDLIQEGADERGMLAGRGDPPVYQLYGEVVQLDGRLPDGEGTTAHLTIRLFDLETREDVFETEHRVHLDELPRLGSAGILGRSIKDALNQAVTEALDDPTLRAVLDDGQV